MSTPIDSERHPGREHWVRSKRFIWSLLALGGVCHWSSVASAQAKDPVAARVLFKQARSAADANDYTSACPMFEESYRLEPAVGTLLNLAACDRRAGRLAMAWAKFQTALDQLPPEDERRPAVQRDAGELEQRAPKLSIGTKPGTCSECTVTRDDVPVGRGSLGVSFPVDPGHHIIAVRAPGHKEHRYDVELAEGQVVELLVEPGKPESLAVPRENAGRVQAAGPADKQSDSSAPAADTHSDSDGRARASAHRNKDGGNVPPHAAHTTAYVLGGLGVAVIGAGVITRIAAFNRQSTLDAHCPNKICDDTGWSARGSAKSLQTISTVSLVAGAAALGAGVYFLLSEPRQKESPRLTLGSVLIPGGGAVNIAGSL
jgi:hypothetical protein